MFEELQPLTPIFHRLSDNSHTLLPHFASQQGGAVLREHCPHPAGRQSAATGERFVQRSGEKWGLTPVHFFALGADCRHYSGRKGLPLSKKYLLPDLSDLTGDQTFAEVALGWSQKGITAAIRVSGSTIEPLFPDFTAGDSVEFFIDTRDVKTSGSNTRFCHHFFFLPLPVQTNGESVQAGEVTRFRTDDSHKFCDSSLLRVSCGRERKSYTLQIFIPAEALHGYDPTQFDRLGFTYRINRYDGRPQHFSASSEDFSIEQHPSTWATLKLIKEK